MAFNKNCLHLVLILMYITVCVTFLVFAKLSKEDKLEISGCKETACLRFCIDDFDVVLLNDTDQDLNFTTEATSLEEKFNKVFGYPCEVMNILDDTFLFSSNLSIFVTEEKLTVDKYCFERKEADGSSEWNVMICNEVTDERRFLLQVIATCVGFFFLYLTLLIYTCINELKNLLHGKCVIGIVASLVFAFAFSRVGFIFLAPLFDVGLICAFLWISAVTFDVWWTLSYFETSSGGQFKHVAFYVVMVAASMLLTLVAFFNIFDVTMAFLILSNLLCIACFIFTAFKIYELTGIKLDFGHKRFAQQESRFLLYLQLHIITLMFLIVEAASRSAEDSYEYLFAAGVLHCFNAFLIFIKLVLKRTVRNTIIRNICCC